MKNGRIGQGERGQRSSRDGQNSDRPGYSPQTVSKPSQIDPKPIVLRNEPPPRPSTPPYKKELDTVRALMEKERKLYFETIEGLRTQLDKEAKAAKAYAQDLSNDLAVAHREANKFADENRTLRREHRTLEQEISSLRDTKQRYEWREKTHAAEATQLRDKVTKLTSDLSICRSENNNYSRENNRLRTDNGSLADANQQFQERIEMLETQVNDLIAEKLALSADNEGLRCDIFKMESTVNPLHDEEFYVQGFQSLKADVEMWVARQCKDNAAETLSVSDERKLLDSLVGFGPTGAGSHDFLETNQAIRAWYSSKRSRIPLIRHLFAIFLLDKVLAPFAAGVHHAFSKALIWIEQDIMSRGFCLCLT